MATLVCSCRKSFSSLPTLAHIFSSLEPLNRRCTFIPSYHQRLDLGSALFASAMAATVVKECTCAPRPLRAENSAAARTVDAGIIVVVTNFISTAKPGLPAATIALVMFTITMHEIGTPATCSSRDRVALLEPKKDQISGHGTPPSQQLGGCSGGFDCQ